MLKYKTIGIDMETTLENIRRKLATRSWQEQGDHIFNPELLKAPPYREASVLIPLLQRGDEYTVLFTQRTAHLNEHAGQVSFPGGGADEGDRDAIATALREAEEEIGLPPENVTVLGTLGHYITRTGYRVTPVVGMVEAPKVWKPDSFEVADIFEVPLSHILKPGMLARQKMQQEGIERHYYALNWESFYIWGATAGMLRIFADVINDDS